MMLESTLPEILNCEKGMVPSTLSNAAAPGSTKVVPSVIVIELLPAKVITGGSLSDTITLLTTVIA